MPGARDGQLRIRRGTDSPPWALQMFDDDLGLWLTLCQADEEAEMIRAGIPILRGPYVVDYTDIPHVGDTITLWVPVVGDVLLRLFVDWQTIVPWDVGQLYIGQNVDGAMETNAIMNVSGASIARATGNTFDLDGAIHDSPQLDGSGVGVYSSAYVFHSTDPVEIQLGASSGGDPAVGHVDLYALVARAVAP